MSPERGRGTRRFRGVDLPPYWRVLPATGGAHESDSSDTTPVIRLRDGNAFGNGMHETTQLCLLALGYLFRAERRPATVLDFGAGSGILAIAAAGRGAHVQAVEIDPDAIECARYNVALNAVASRVEVRTSMREPAEPVDLVLANILRSVLLAFADALCARQSREGHMVLSGLVGTDVPAILARYKPRLAPMQAHVHARGEWRAVMFSPPGLRSSS